MKVTIGIIDYGAGNVTSVRQSLFGLGYRCRVSADPDTLSKCDVLILPGVGAFPSAMASLKKLGLDTFIRNYTNQGRPFIGICLGMQLLAESSNEIEFTEGLGLIPGHVTHIENNSWHIGWNTICLTRNDYEFQELDGAAFYFNHAFSMKTEKKYIVAEVKIDTHNQMYVAVVRNENVIGIQFHPEKSQSAGKLLFKKVIDGFFDVI